MKTGEDLYLQKRMLKVGKLKYNKDLWIYAPVRRVHKWGFKNKSNNYKTYFFSLLFLIIFFNRRKLLL